jgi:ribosomal protein S27AE
MDRGNSIMGLMSSSNRQKALNMVERNYRQCPNCGMRQPSMLDEVIGLPLLEQAIPSGVSPANRWIPVLQVQCKNCGILSFFLASEFVDRG